MSRAESATESDHGELPGLYTANITGTNNDSPYPSTVKQVFVCPERDGYHDVYLIDDDGQITAAGNRPAYRIEAALEGDEGYDVLVNGS